VSDDSWQGLCEGSLTALSVHLNKECSHRHFTSWNSQVEEEDRNPCVKKEFMKVADFRNDCDVVS
jgi:hypothetical protein